MEITLISVGLVLLTQFIKKFVQPKWGATGMHILVFALALAVVTLKSAMTQYPPLGDFVMSAGQLLVGAIAFYEVVWKELSKRLNLVL